MNVLVTGGAGFIGSTLSAELLDRGHSVTVLDNLSTGRESLIPDGADFVEADVKDRDDISDVLGSRDIDRVYHLAGNVGVRTQNTDRDRDVEENILGTHNVLEAMYVNGVDDLVFVSSSTIYGDADETPTPEDYAPKEPVSLYSAAKLSCEKLISVYTASFGLEATVLRPANIVGGSDTGGVIHDFVAKLSEDSTSLEVLGNGEQQKPFLHVSDCVDALVLAPGDRQDRFEVYNVANKTPISITRLAEVVIDELGVDAEIQYTGGTDPSDVPVIDLDTSRLREKGWAPSIDSEETVRRTVNEILER